MVTMEVSDYILLKTRQEQMTNRTSPTFRRIHLLQRVSERIRANLGQRVSERIRADLGQLGSFHQLSEEGVFAETLEKFYLSSVLELATHSCL